MSAHVKESENRKQFEKTLSNIYANEVPLYSKTLPIVEEMNEKARRERGLENEKQPVQEHHGAIRVGTAEELKNMSRLFRVMGMEPVNYYDLSVANLPVHSTAFRATTKEGLEENGFRVFCSLLREDLLPKDLQPKVKETLEKRQIISDKAMEMIEAYEEQGGLTEEQSKIFIEESAKTFQWNEKATVSKEFYEELLETNSLVADIVSFSTPHINHLTPKTENIDALFLRFHEEGIETTPVIQGPPPRENPILLRQMAFKALEAKSLFPDGKDGYEEGKHRARFGEYETKEDMAVTPKGRELYDELLNKVRSKTSENDPNYMNILQQEFKAFPDTKEELREKGLAYFRYSVNEEALGQQGSKSINSWEDAIKKGVIEYDKVPYHDFLPVSAAGIFKSNLMEGGFVKAQKKNNSQEEFEKALGRKVIDSFELYEAQEKESIEKVSSKLGIEPSKHVKNAQEKKTFMCL